MRRISVFIFLLLLTVTLSAQKRTNLRQLGITQLQNELYLEALHTLNDAILQEPNASELYFLRGYAKYGLDDFLGAEKDYTRSLELFPYQPDVYINRAVVRSQQENFAGAYADFSAAIEIDSTNASIYLNRARISLYAKEFDECINDCYRVIDLEKGHEKEDGSGELVYLIKGSAEMGLGNHYTSIPSFQKAIEVNPKNPFGFIQLASAWLELERSDSALTYLNQALKVDSANIYALFNRSIALANLKDASGALSLTAVIRLNPENLISHYYRGLLYLETNKYASAIDDFTRTIELFPDYADGYMARSQAKEAMKDRKGAAIDHQLGLEAVERNRNHPDTLAFDEKNHLRNLIHLTGTFEEMNTLTSKFQNQYVDIQLAPVFQLFYGQAPYSEIDLYDSYPKEHYYTTIISLFNKPHLISDSLKLALVERQTLLLDSVNRNPETYLIRAVCYDGLGKYPEAIRDCDSALSLDPGFVLPWFVRANAWYGLYLQRQEERMAGALPGINSLPPEAPDSATLLEDASILEAMFLDYKKTILLDPGFPYAYYNRGVALAGLGNYNEALLDFRRSVDSKRNFASGYYNLGLIYLLLKDKGNGCALLSQAGELGIADAYKVMKRFCY